MQLSNVLWAERGAVEKRMETKGYGRNWEMLMKEKLVKEARDCIIKGLYLLEGGQEER